jgi:hypothetical protein
LCKQLIESHTEIDFFISWGPQTGLPDGIFSNQKKNILNNFWSVLEWKMLYFMSNWYILCSFGTFYVHLAYLLVIWYLDFFPFWYVVPRKIWQPCPQISGCCCCTFQSKRIRVCLRRPRDVFAPVTKWL